MGAPKLEAQQLARRVEICEVLLKRNEEHLFLKQIITADEKWVMWNNTVRTRSWKRPGEAPQSVPKPDSFQKKLMPCVFWNFQGIVHYEFLLRGQTITAALYCPQLEKAFEAIKKQRPGLVNRFHVVIQHDSSHTARMTKAKLEELNFGALPHPAYSPDLAPSDDYLFRSLQNSLRGEVLETDEELKDHVARFFRSKSKEFFKEGIFRLPSLWLKGIL